MKREIFGCSVISLAIATILAIGVGSARAQQGIGASISQADQIAAAAAVAGGHYAIEVTPTQEGVTKGSSAFARFGEAASSRKPASAVDPAIILPTPVWGPVDLFNFMGSTTITSWVQWNVYLGCDVTHDQTCWGNPQQFITDLNGSKFIHLLDQYVGSNAPKRYPRRTPLFLTVPRLGHFLVWQTPLPGCTPRWELRGAPARPDPATFFICI